MSKPGSPGLLACVFPVRRSTAFENGPIGSAWAAVTWSPECGGIQADVIDSLQTAGRSDRMLAPARELTSVWEESGDSSPVVTWGQFVVRGPVEIWGREAFRSDCISVALAQ